ncbi:MAG: nuclease [Gemmatimonadaceae bacterium]|nr:nuclease [Gemmatimonadaceae bacterium]
MSRFRISSLLAAAGAALLCVPVTLNAWGDHGHRLVGLTAAKALPEDMPAFFRDAAEQLSYLNPEPDRWKSRDESRRDMALNGGTSPDHFMDLDFLNAQQLAGAFAAPDRHAFADSVRAAGYAPATMGFLPFTILEYAQKLRNDFRLWRIAPDSTVRRWIENRIIEDAGVLGHFVADGSNPHHTSKHYNGWVGDNPKGYPTDNRFHSRFESQFVQAHIKEADVRSAMTHAPQVFPDLRVAVVAFLMASNAQLEPLYALDKATPFRPETVTPEQKAFAVARLGAGAEMLRDIWYTAWVTSAVSPTPR